MQMTAVLDSYSAQLRASLPDLHDAVQNSKHLGGFTKIQDALAEVAKQNHSSHTFGLHLLHCHSHLDDGEIMVECGHVAQPFRLSDLTPAARSGLRPTLWALSPDTKKFTPLQFAFNDNLGTEGIDDLDAALAEAVAGILVQHGLEHIFGLATTVPGQGLMVETTQGRAEIITPACNLVDHPAAVEVLWPLISMKEEQKCAQVCHPAAKAKHFRTHDGYAGLSPSPDDEP